MDDDIKVSVVCITYNQERFIKQCLDGFANQKTNFKYEIIIYDDASTDTTKEIIEEYVKKYPNLFVPIFEKENQFSKGVKIVDEIMLPKAKGKYIAICEGDDYWCDENKLQLQYDFMEAHPNCATCLHNTIQHDLLGRTADHKFNNFKGVHYLTPAEVIKMGAVHTSSYFVRKEIFATPKQFTKYFFSDYVRLTNYMLKGQLAVLPNVMSVYNYNNTAGLTYINYNQFSLDKHINEIQQVINYLKEFNEFSQFEYDVIIKNKISEIEFYIESKKAFDKMKTSNGKDFYLIRNELKNHPYYQIEQQGSKGLNKIKFLIKYKSPRWLWQLAFKIAKK